MLLRIGQRLQSISIVAAYQKDPFTILKNNNKFSTDTSMTDAGASMYQLLFAIGVIGILVSLILGGIKLAISRNAATRQEVKKAITVKFLIAVVLFGFVSILGLILEVINSM